MVSIVTPIYNLTGQKRSWLGHLNRNWKILGLVVRLLLMLQGSSCLDQYHGFYMDSHSNDLTIVQRNKTNKSQKCKVKMLGLESEPCISNVYYYSHIFSRTRRSSSEPKVSTWNFPLATELTKDGLNCLGRFSGWFSDGFILSINNYFVSNLSLFLGFQK